MSNNAKHVILIIIDNVRADQFFTFYNEGKLPNLKKIGDKGIICEHCVTSFPSVTLPAQSNIMTGSYSGYYPKSGSGIPAYNWFDRDTDPPQYRNYSMKNAVNMRDDIGTNVKTLFEQMGEEKLNTYSVAQLCSRGVTDFFPNSIIKGFLYYLYYSILKKKPELFHTKVTERLIDVFKNPRKFFKNNNKPTAVVGLYLATDILSHELGFESLRYKEALLNIDSEIGRLIRELEKLGIFKDTVIAITADHGSYKARKAGNIIPFLEKRGLVQYNNKTGRGDLDLVFNSLGFFTFKGKTWKDRPLIEELKNYIPTVGGEPINLIDMMFEIEGVKFVYFRDDNNTPEKGIINILKKENNKILKCYVEYLGDTTRYTTDSADIYNYSKDSLASKMIDGKFHTIDEWLAHTHHLDFPMLPDQIMRYFKNPRSCDILVSTLSDVSYNHFHGKNKNLTQLHNHDIGLKCSMYVPLIIGGSEIVPVKKLEYCKTTDIVPTLLYYLGKKPHESVVGRNLGTV